MGSCGQDRVAAFDAFFTNQHIQKLKVLLPYLDPALQRNLAVYIKYLELQCAFRRLQDKPRGSLPLPSRERENETGQDAFPQGQTLPRLCEELFPYCTKAEQDRLNGIRSLYQTMEQYRQIMETMEMMKELFPQDSSSKDPAAADNFSDLLAGLTGPGGGNAESDTMIQMKEILELLRMMSPAEESPEA